MLRPVWVPQTKDRQRNCCLFHLRRCEKKIVAVGDRTPVAQPVGLYLAVRARLKNDARTFSLLTWHAEPLARPFGLPIGMYLYDVERIGYSFCSSQAVVLETQCQCPGGLVALGD